MSADRSRRWRLTTAPLAGAAGELFARIRGSRAFARRSATFVVPSACAAVLNIAIIGLILIGLRLPASEGERELHLVLSPIQHADVRPDVSIPAVEIPVLQMPEIVIAPEGPRPAATASFMVLAPRPDPAHPNPAFAGAKDLPGADAPAAIVLRILVRSDGTVADAAVARTSGRPDADAAAIDFIKTQWKFLPALLDGRPIEYWTTVAVRLS